MWGGYVRAAATAGGDADGSMARGAVRGDSGSVQVTGVVGPARSEDLIGTMVGEWVLGQARVVDDFGEAAGAKVALGEGLDVLHDLVACLVEHDAAENGLGDTLPAGMTLLVARVVISIPALGLVVGPLGAWRSRVILIRSFLPRRPATETQPTDYK